MAPDLLDILVCPMCKGTLTLEASETRDDGDVLRGKLRCAECRETYPIEDGIPNLLPPDMRDD
ncbi:MAG: methytransferase partner Trm112 [Dehalococcoidia bacterium]